MLPLVTFFFSSSKFDSVEFKLTSSLPDDKVLYRVLVLALWLDGHPKEQKERGKEKRQAGYKSPSHISKAELQTPPFLFIPSPPHPRDCPLENLGHSSVSLSSNLIILRTGPRGIMPQTVLGCLSYSICSFLLYERWPRPDKLFVWPVSRSQTTFGNHCFGALQICTHNSSTGLFPSVS